jgi:hypothetical protein
MPGEDALSAVLAATADKGTEKTRQDDPAAASHAQRILQALKETEGPMSLEVLAGEARLGFLALSQILIEMHRRGVIRLSGSPGHEMISLSSGQV